MGTKHQNWFKFEEDVQSALGLDAMPGSGNQWHAPSDGATPRSSDTLWPLMVDCKHTVQKGYSLTRKALDQWVRTAQSTGHRFALPIRFETVDDTSATRSDYVVVPLDDYVELVDFYRNPTTASAPSRKDIDFLHKLAAAALNDDLRRRLLAIISTLER